jgi:uncharacterized protein (DUF1501 family)
MDKVLQSCSGVSDRALVLIQLKGGNDGLNTVVPLNQYDQYMQLRPTIGLSNSGLTPLIQLDNTLPIQDQVGINPAMTNFKALYDQGFASIVQGVGYQSMNQSHFKGTDLWLSGGGGSYDLNNLTSGWMGRALDAREIGGGELAVARGQLGRASHGALLRRRAAFDALARRAAQSDLAAARIETQETALRRRHGIVPVVAGGLRKSSRRHERHAKEG